MRPGIGERYGTVVVTWVGAGEGLLQPTPKPTAPPLPRSGRRDCGRNSPPTLHPCPAGSRAKLSPRPAAAKPPGTPGRGGSWVTSSRPRTPFLPVFLVTVDSSLLFPNPLSLYREGSHSCLIPHTEGALTSLTPLSDPRGAPILIYYLLPFLYLAGAIISIDSLFLISGIVPTNPGSS